VAACGGGDDAGAPQESPPDTAAGATQLSVAVASFDLAVGDDSRFLVGLFTSGRDLVLGGDVETSFQFFPDGGGEPEEVTSTEASFLPVPGKEPSAELSQPTAVSPAEGAGVYETRVDFDRPGIWGVVVTADVQDVGRIQGNAQFVVADEHAVVAPGEPAPLTEGPVVDSDVPPVQIDSRAQGEDAEVPDPELHDTTVAEAIAAGRPVVVVVATPTYCASQFCGPITDAVAELAQEYGDVAEFIHLEVWKDFNAEQLNEAAAAWIQTEAGGNEPWVFLVDGDGIVQKRWDNVLDRAELVEALEAL
jgi:hypothetical protein